MTQIPGSTDERGPSSLRDFLYVDAPRMRSLYAQVFQNVVEDVLNDRISEALAGETNTIGGGKGKETSERETETLNSVRRSERGVLHDHMYNQLEEKLQPIIADARNLSEAEVASRSSEMPFVRVRGRIEIEDYSRIREFADRFNSFAELIAYSRMQSEQSDEDKQRVVKLEALLRGDLSKGQRQQFERELRELNSTTEQSLQMGLVQPEQLLENVKFMIDMYEDSAYHIVVAQAPDARMRYRGVLDPSQLRMELAHIRGLYGDQSSATWTMVGSVTYVPKTFDEWTDPAGAVATPVNSATGLPSMLDSLRGVTRSSRAFEQAFLESTKTFEVVVSPLAIYREYMLDRPRGQTGSLQPADQ